MFPAIHLDPWTTNLDAIDTTGAAKVGGLYVLAGEIYMFVLNNSADTNAIAGQFALHDDAGTMGYMTMKASEAGDGGVLGTVAKATGIWCYAVAFGNYGFLKVAGWTKNGSDAAFLVTDGSVAQGNPLVCDGGATPTFIADTAIAGEEHAVVAHAIADDTADPVVMATLNCL